MLNLKESELAYWNEYAQALALGEVTVTAGYAGNAEITDELLALYLKGKKTAGSSVLEDFVCAGAPLPQVGHYWILLNGRGQPGAILKTVRIVQHKFEDVPIEIAVAEGEGDSSLAHWRRVHAEIWTPHLARWGLRDMNEATVVTEFFVVVHQSSAGISRSRQ